MKRDSWYDEDEDVGHTRMYTLLRLRPTCSAEEIQKSFRLLSKVFHPDKSALSSVSSTSFTAVKTNSERSGDATDDGTFVALQLCVEVLSDRVLRKGYDVGGVRAVRLLQRSQRHHPSHAGEANHLYATVANTKTEDEAVFLLQEALEELQLQEAQRRRQSTGGGAERVAHLDASLACPMIDFEQESSAVSVSFKKPVSLQTMVMTSASHSLQPTGVGHMSVGIGCEHVSGAQPSPSHLTGSSTFAADARFSSTRRAKGENSGWLSLPCPDLAFRTRRQLSSGTVVAVDLFGNLLKNHSWSYSLSSFRNLKLYGSGPHDGMNGDVEESSPLHVQALWRCRIQAATGLVMSLVAQLRTSAQEEAQYRLRLSLINPNSIKFAYRSSSYSDPKGGLAVSWTLGFWVVWSKFKVTWRQRIGGGRLTCRYGIKYDSRAVLMLLLPAGEAGRQCDTASPWTLLAYVYSSETTIRVPISFSSGSPAISVGVAWVVSMLLANWIEPALRNLRKGGQHDSQVDSQVRTRPIDSLDDHPVSEILLRTMPAVIREVAGQKRDLEGKVDGLVVQSVKVEGSSDNEMRDYLQFWVVGSSLRLPKAEIWHRGQRVRPSDESTWSSWEKWLRMPGIIRRRVNKSSSGTTCDNARTSLAVRYSYRGWVYESAFSNDDDFIVIPSTRFDRTTRLGRQSHVH
jgi:DnaJ domain